MAGVLIVSVVGLPLLSRAGVNFARRRRMLQVAESSDPLPVDWVMLQPTTLPSGPMVNAARAVPSAPADWAAAG